MKNKPNLTKSTKSSSSKAFFDQSALIKNNKILQRAEEKLIQILESNEDIEKKIAHMQALFKSNSNFPDPFKGKILTHVSKFYAELSGWFTCNYNILMETPGDFIDLSDLYLASTDDPETFQYTVKSPYDIILTDFVTKENLGLASNETLPETLTQAQYSNLIDITSAAGHTLSEKDACTIAITHLSTAILTLTQAISLVSTSTEKNKLTRELDAYNKRKTNLYAQMHSFLQEQETEEQYDAAKVLKNLCHSSSRDLEEKTSEMPLSTCGI